MSRRPTGEVLPERPRIRMAIVERIIRDSQSRPIEVSGQLPTPTGDGRKPYVQQSRSAYSGRRKVIALPERGSADYFLE
jgi:hypothetical protein